MARVVVGQLILQVESLGVWLRRSGLELVGRMTMEKTLSSGVLYPNGICGIGAAPSPGSLLFWRQDICVLWVFWSLKPFP